MHVIKLFKVTDEFKVFEIPILEKLFQIFFIKV